MLVFVISVSPHGLYAFAHLNLWFAGVIELVSDFVVCEEGKPLSPESSRILVCLSRTRNHSHDSHFSIDIISIKLGSSILHMVHA